ncbi:MAG: hypothetical protein U0R50_00925 [Gaiellales bacterium]
MSLYDAVRDLPLEIERYALSGLELEAAFLRKTTIVTLSGAGEDGAGEDVTYEEAEHDAFQARGADLPLAGTWTLDTFSQQLAKLPLFTVAPDQHAYLDYRRWAFESAALDLALRQAGVSLAELVGREVRPLRFVVSMRLEDAAATAALRSWLAIDPTLSFKLDATPAWTDGLVAELAGLDCVDAVDFKGQYRGTSVDNPADPALYRRVLEGLPHAWLEDPELTPETVALLDPVAARVTWDAPIHSVDDIVALHWAPRSVNLKPSRFGSVGRLFAAYDHCLAHGIDAYGGGQWELGVGRDHIQLLAAIFHPDASNDVAPRAYNVGPTAGLPRSPLVLAPRETGFALT